MFSKCNFRTHYNVASSTILIESLKFRNNSRITVTSPSNLFAKTVNMRFLNIMVFYCFSLEAVLQSVAKNTPTEEQIDAEIQVTLRHAPA